MTSRKPGYLIGIFLLAIVLSIPSGYLCVQFAVRAVQNRSWPLPLPPGFGGFLSGSNRLTNNVFWNDQFVRVNRITRFGGNPDPSHEMWMNTTDPETGKTGQRQIRLPNIPNDGTYNAEMAFGDRLFQFERSYKSLPGFAGIGPGSVISIKPSNATTLEIINEIAEPSELVDPDPLVGVPMTSGFLLNGEPAFVDRSFPNRYRVSIFRDGTWTKWAVVLPEPGRSWSIGNTQFDFQMASQIDCLQQGDRVHLFAIVHRKLLCREGLVLRPLTPSERIAEGGSAMVLEGDESPLPPAAVAASASVENWSVVDPDYDSPSSGFSNQSFSCQFLVSQQPAALIFDRTQPGRPTGVLYRYDGQAWSRHETVSFPFGTIWFQSAIIRDGQKSYLVATTTLGWAHVYRIDSTGIQLTMSSPPDIERHLNYMIGEYTKFPQFGFVTGILLGLGVWFFMWRNTAPTYEFGARTVKLASIGRRGLARLIDLLLILGSTAGLAWFLTLGFDWSSLVEALNLKVEHPTIQTASRIAVMTSACLLVITLMFIVTQGVWGATPGKWCCGLRTVQSSLRPCGLARSLARELVMCVDVLNFLWWAPGIVSIALTNRRQRLGDLVGDTIVVESRTLQGS